MTGHDAGGVISAALSEALYARKFVFHALITAVPLSELKNRHKPSPIVKDHAIGAVYTVTTDDVMEHP
ncbi:hypothetical protein KSP9073_00927 [Kushneria phyllosphaerae]|uniref:Uncharacterized protein n=1 Tax=Kushneria phyllosphaerae TaxID=2100822 RepID=A0A2R8CJ61_9GAMM|nr:hypothetical protein KSP9073_00927 [Kushneria phyllosphaerae]